ncbi:Helix-turn-helix domain protein [Shimia sp. SK013]|uniref:helix-turn-helix transcriptional regulator n=1 Tax=Shimia sp. SK013 TaxID=1389006 RepID=UPI0006B5C078|nr:helix-turn-helix transcriptional regulator [Shimia sp. SK013]KPA22772.1 Helix-turn-helix domain protein [Shimia sp. SK013]
MGLDFGAALKEWRSARRISQLDLGLSAGVSSRHISFLETGRSRPSRGMVLRLCDELDVPMAQRNRMLTAAGLSPAYAERELSEEDMAPMRAAVDWTLARHDPYPAMAIDRHWRLVSANRSCTTLLAGLGAKEGDSLLDMMIGNPVMRQALENYDEVARHMLARLRVEAAHFGHDDVLEAAIAGFEGIVGGAGATVDGIRPAVIPATYVLGGMRLTLFSTISQFGSAEDIALSELRIEMMFPADDETRMALEMMA